MEDRFSFITANYVAKPLGFEMPDGWAQGDKASNQAFAPLVTFAERFEEVLQAVKTLGFESIDLWAAHLHWQWASSEHIQIATNLLAKYELEVRSYSAWVMGDVSDLDMVCRFCNSLKIPFIAGHIELVVNNRQAAVSILRSFGIGYAIENHTETSIEKVSKRLGEGDEDVIGIALDTGWCGTREWDALAGLNVLYDRIFTVHLKDVRAKRSQKTGYEFIDLGHETCRLGDGIVPVKAVLKELRRRDFRGSIGIEHEPELYDPSDEIRDSLVLAKKWWDYSDESKD